MKNLKNVISFEYMSIAKSRGFLLTTLMFIVLAIGLGTLPLIIDFFSNTFGNDDPYTQTRHVAVIDETGIFTQDVLASHLPDVSFTHYSPAQIEHITTAIEDGDYIIAVNFVTATSYAVLFNNNMAGPPSIVRNITQLVTNQYQRRILDEHNLSPFLAIELENLYIEQILIPLGGFGFLVGQIVNMLVFFPLILSGSMISTSIVNEKTSKTVELLFTSSNPSTIMYGKVIGVGLVILTQVTLAVTALVSTIILTESDLTELFSPEILGALLYPITYVYVLIFFTCAFILFSFIFAALAATIRDVQETNSVAVIPTVIIVGCFYISLFGVAMQPEWVTQTMVNIVSFVPFVSPMVMIIRVTSFEVPTHQILSAIAVNIVTVVVVAKLSAKMYKEHIMAYGQKTSRFSLLRKLQKK